LGVTVLIVMIPKTAENMKETRKRRVKEGRRRIVVTSRKTKRVGITKSQPTKIPLSLLESRNSLIHFSEIRAMNDVNLKRSRRRESTI